MANRIGDAPIDPKLTLLMNGLGRAIDTALNGDIDPASRENGFVLLVFPFEGLEGRCNYISNASRADVIVLLKEQLARFEGMPEAKGRG